MEKGTLTLYTVIDNPDRIVEALKNRFKELTKEVVWENGRVTLTLQDDTHIVFNLSHQQDKPEFIASHTAGMAGFFMQAETVHTELKANVVRQIRVFNCVTGILFGLDDNDDRTSYIINRLYEIAGDVHGFLLYPNMQIHSSEGKLLFSSTGESELTGFVPIGNADLLDTNHCEVAESGTCIKSREEMIQRAAALFAVAVYSEVMLSNDSSREEALAYFNKVDQLYGIKAYLTCNEAAYINNPSPERQECIQFVWRYECCGVLLWAAGIVDDLPYPSAAIDVPVLAAIYWQHKGMDDLSFKGFSRSKTEILDAANLTQRYDWACVDARIHGKETPSSLDSGVVVERHYAFSWITGANSSANWDAIQPR